MASNRARAESARRRKPAASRRSTCRNWATNSSAAGATSSAASLGVRARTSAARSDSVTSISCPTAETTGIREAAIARTTGSSLNAQRSSMLPPPRVTTRQSIGVVRRLTVSMAAAISAAAPSPCTRTGTTSTSAPRQRRANTWRKSRMAAPVGTGDHGDSPHQRGQRPLAGSVEQSFPRQFLPQLPQRQLQRPHAPRHDVLDDQLVAAALGVDVEMAAADHFQAVVQVEADANGHAPPHHGPQLGPVVLQGQVAVARLGPGEVRHLAHHPDLRKRGLQQVFDLGGQFPDGQRALGRRVYGRHGSN